MNVSLFEINLETHQISRDKIRLIWNPPLGTSVWSKLDKSSDGPNKMELLDQWERNENWDQGPNLDHRLSILIFERLLIFQLTRWLHLKRMLLASARNRVLGRGLANLSFRKIFERNVRAEWTKNDDEELGCTTSCRRNVSSDLADLTLIVWRK